MRDRIIQESIASLRKEGLRFSIDTLAERLGISKKTIYKYFATKEALALALYQSYYADMQARAKQLAKKNAASAHVKLLKLYFDAKAMTSGDIFNKYKLNEALYAYTAQQNEQLWEIILASLRVDLSSADKTALRIIVDGSFEKLCQEKSAPDGVIDRMVNMLWL